jgi:hypothetical protein
VTRYGEETSSTRRWKGLDMRSRSGGDNHQGRATYDLTADRCSFVDLWMDSDSKDYMIRLGV